MPTYPDCSYVSVDDVNEPTGASYIYCLAAEVRELKHGIANIGEVESELTAGIVAPYYWADTVLAMHMDSPDDPYWDNVVLAMRMDGSGATFIDDKGHAISTRGAAVHSTADSKYGGISGYFDGAFLTVIAAYTPSADFNLGDTATIEYYVNMDPAHTGLQHHISIHPFGAILANDNRVSFTRTAAGIFTMTGFGLYKENLNMLGWRHVAVILQPGASALYIDGILQATGVPSGFSGDQEVSIGAFSTDYFGSSWAKGYLDEIRITKWVARYTGTFTPPTAMQQPFIDEKGHTVTVAGSAVISTARSKFGGASALFDHTGNCLVPYSTDFNIGINDFTIKGWCYRTTSGADRVFFSLIDNNADSWNNRLFIGKTTEERLQLVIYTAAGTQIAITNPTPMPSGQWVHFLACRISGTYYLAEDGVFVASSTPALITHDNSGVCIGNSYPGSLGWQGNVDDLEFIIHRTTLPQPAIDFTPPTTAFKHP